MPRSQSPITTCPRCGYDLSGAVATWTDSCPLELTCSECGYNCDTRLLMRPELAEWSGFFESATLRPRQALVHTASRTLRPWAFWSWVRMEWPPNLWRMVFGGALSMLSSYLVVGVLMTALVCLPARTGRGYWTAVGDRTWDILRIAFTPFLESRTYWDGDSQVLTIFALSIWALTPFMFLLPFTLKRAKVRGMQLARVFAWSGLMVPVAIQVPLLVPHMASNWYTTLHPYQWNSTTPWKSWQSYEELLFWLHKHDGRNAAILTIAWVLLWWGFACGRYLRLPRPWIVVPVLVALAIVITVGLLFLVMQHEMMEVLV